MMFASDTDVGRLLLDDKMGSIKRKPFYEVHYVASHIYDQGI